MTDKCRQRYSYRGSVILFGREIAGPWEGSTLAVSEAQARNNIKFQVKRDLDLPPHSPIQLPGRFVCQG